jgi:hypothetical protein
VKKKIPTAENKIVKDSPKGIVFQDDRHAFDTAGEGVSQPVRRTLQRYCTMALTIAVCAGGLLMIIGLRPIGKGLILGSLFSVLNFILMSTALPLRVGLKRRKSFLFSLGSVYVRYALLAVPLILAIKQDLIAVSTVAAGLFMVQIAILGDQLWDRLRNPVKVNC